MTSVVKEVRTIESFDKLDNQKQQEILDAACIEFASKGYELASTNEIVKQAGISKGMLFYYFESKQKLYQYLVGKALKMMTGMIHQIDDLEPDFLLRYYKMALLEMELYHQQQTLFMFMGSLIKNPMDLLEPEMQQDVYKMMTLFQQKKDNIEHINVSLFRDDLDVQQAIDIIKYALIGYEQVLTNRLLGTNMAEAQYEPVMNEFSDFLLQLRNIFYKEEYR